MNIRDWLTRSHPSKGENRTGNRSCERALRMKQTFVIRTQGGQRYLNGKCQPRVECFHFKTSVFVAFETFATVNVGRD